MLWGVAAASLMLLKRWGGGGWNYNKGNMGGKVIIITGANSGIGKICVRELARRNPAKIIMACRSEKRGLKALNEIKEELNIGSLELILLDLGN